MVKIYDNGQELIDENDNYLKTNKYQTAFFYINAPNINKDKTNYAIKDFNDNEKLLIMKDKIHNAILFGSENCVQEAIDYLLSNNYIFENYMCEEKLGLCILNYLNTKYHFNYTYGLKMDLMEATEIFQESSKEVEEVNEEDIDELLELMNRFIIDCGLLDKMTRDKLASFYKQFRVIRKDNKIVSCVRICPNTDDSEKIAGVYTRDEYRGQGLAKKTVNAAKNEILQRNHKAVLNVDQNNPISNHVYKSVGFKKMFSQGEFRKG